MTERKLKHLMNNISQQISFDKDWSLNLKKQILLNLETEKEVEKINYSLYWSRFISRLTNVFVPQQFAVKPIATFSLILGLFLISGFASVNASKNSLPGDTLYPLKLTAENLKYSLSFSSEGKAKNAMNRIEKRMSELKIMAVDMSFNNNNDKKEKMAKTALEIKNNLKVVTTKIQAIGTEVNESEIKTAQEIDAKLALAKNDLDAIGQTADSDLNTEIAALKEQLEKASALTVATINNNENKQEDKKDESNNNLEPAVVESLPDVSSENLVVEDEKNTSTKTLVDEEFIKDLIVEKEAPQEEFKVKMGE